MTIESNENEKYGDIPASGKETFQNTFQTKAVGLLIELCAADGTNPIDELSKIDRSNDGMYKYLFDLVNNDSFWENNRSDKKNQLREKTAELVSKRFMGKEVRGESQKNLIEESNKEAAALLQRISGLVSKYHIADVSIDTDIDTDKIHSQLKSLQYDENLWSHLPRAEDIDSLQNEILMILDNIEYQKNYKS